MVARQTHMAAFVVRGRPGPRTAAGSRRTPISTARRCSAIRTSAFAREYTRAARAGSAFGPDRMSRWRTARSKPRSPQGRGDVAADFVDLLPRFQAAADPFGVTIDCLPFHEAGIDVYGSGLVTSTRLLDEAPDRVARAVAAFREALLAEPRRPGARARQPAEPDPDRRGAARRRRVERGRDAHLRRRGLAARDDERGEVAPDDRLPRRRLRAAARPAPGCRVRGRAAGASAPLP